VPCSFGAVGGKRGYDTPCRRYCGIGGRVQQHRVPGPPLSGASALGDFGVSLMFAGNVPGRTQTLPLYIYNQVETLNFARAHGAALLLVGAGLASLYAVRMLEEGRNGKHASC